MGKNDHVTDHLIKLHWLPISQRRIFKILLLVFKALNGQGPIYLAEMLLQCSNSEHDLRSSYDNLLVVPATDSVTYGDRAFSVLGPSLWNNLPKKIRCSSSVPSFRSALKTHLFKQSFGFNIISSKYFLVTLNCVVCRCILGELFLIFA